jgi:hypothetical protein
MFREEFEIAGKPKVVRYEFGHERSVVERAVRKGAGGGAGRVDGGAIGADAIRHAAIGALAFDQVDDGGFDFFGFQQIAGAVDHVLKVARPECPVVAAAIRSEQCGAVFRTKSAAIQLSSCGLFQPGDVLGVKLRT